MPLPAARYTRSIRNQEMINELMMSTFYELVNLDT